MRITVTGKSGQVVSSLRAVAPSSAYDVVFLGRPELDLAQTRSIRQIISDTRPDVLISAAAYTAVDRAEDDRDLAWRVNAEAPAELARAAAELGVPILHLSTDYVFAGDKNGLYTEADSPSPQNVYGETKLAGEEQICSVTDNYVILRTAWVYSAFGSNFVKTMLRLGENRTEVSVVDDQHGCPTYGDEIGRALLEISDKVSMDFDPQLRGIFNLTGAGDTTWAGFAKAIFEGSCMRTGRMVHVNPISTLDYPTAARRPLNSRLSGDKLSATYGIQLDHWRSSLERCLDQLLGPSEYQN